MAEITALTVIFALLAVIIVVLVERTSARRRNAAGELLRALASIEKMNDPRAVHYREIHESALGNINRIIKAYPEVSDAWGARAMVLVRLGRFEESLGSFNSAISLNRKNTTSLKGKGMVLAGLGRHADAIKAFSRANRLQQGDAETLYCLSRLYAATTDKDRALRTLSMSVNIDSGYKEIAKTDKEFECLRGDGAFTDLVS
jgi:tetratricopeptide (TPR) repeat protein